MKLNSVAQLKRHPNILCTQSYCVWLCSMYFSDKWITSIKISVFGGLFGKQCALHFYFRHSHHLLRLCLSEVPNEVLEVI